jgi:hypothetical protein
MELIYHGFKIKKFQVKKLIAVPEFRINIYTFYL